MRPGQRVKPRAKPADRPAAVWQRLLMTLTRLCKALGRPRLRRWSHAIERVKAAEAAGAPPAADRYDLAADLGISLERAR